jgi:hypothetical protein
MKRRIFWGLVAVGITAGVAWVIAPLTDTWSREQQAARGRATSRKPGTLPTARPSANLTKPEGSALVAHSSTS